MKSKRLSAARLSFPLATALAALLATPIAHAVSGNWADNTGNFDWSDATKWSSNPTVPGTTAGDIINFTNNITAARQITVNTTSRTMGALTIGDSDNSHAFTLATSGGGTLIFDNSGLGATLTENGSVADAINASIVLNDNLAATINGALTLGGSITTSSGKTLTKTGAGTLTISGNNTHSANISSASGLTLSTAGTSTFNGNLTLSGGSLVISSAGTTIAGSGLLTLSGGVTLSIPNSGAGTIIDMNQRWDGNLATTLVSASGQTITSNGTVTLNANVTVSNKATMIFNNGIGELSGPRNLTVTNNTGTNTFIVNGTNTYTGSTTISSGTFRVGGSGSLGSGNYAGAITNTAAFEYSSSTNQILSGAITGAAGTLTKNTSTASTLTLSGAGANTYTGLTTVSTGTLELNKSGAVNAIAGGGLTIGGANNTAATVQYTGASSDMMGTGAVTINGRGIIDFNGKTDTIGNVAIVSTGATTSNPTPIINTTGGGNLTIGTLGITPVAGFTSVVNAGTGTITLGGDVTFTAATTGRAQISGTALELGGANRNFNVGLGTGATQDLLIDAQITGVRSLTKTGAGRLTLANTNAYTLGTTVSTGTLLLSGAFNMPSTGTLAVSNGGTFSLADGTARATTGATTGVGLTLATGSWLAFDWNGSSLDSFTTTGTATSTGTVVLNINNTSPSGSGGTLITSSGVSTLNAATYLLANNTNYTATISKTTTTVSIGAQTAVTALTDAYWKGGQVTGALGTMTVSTGSLSNWASDAAGAASGLTPGSGANLIFGATGAAQQASVITGLSDMSVNSITFNDSTAVTIAGSPNIITLNSTSGTAATSSGSGTTVTAGSAISVTSSAAAANAISANLALGANQTWNVASTKNLTVSGAVSGAFSLTKADAGTVTLSNASNTYSGGTNLAAGTLNFASGALGTAGNITFTGNSTLQWASGNTQDISSRLVMTNGVTSTLDTQANNVTLASAIGNSSTGALTKAGSGTLALSVAPTYTGATTITGGTFDVSAIVGGGSPISPLAFTPSIAFTTANSTFKAASSGTALTSYPSMSIANGITVTFDRGGGGNNTAFAIPSLTGGGTFSATNAGGAGTNVTFTTLAGFTGNLELKNAVGNAFNTPDLTDTALSKIMMSSASTGSTPSFNYTGSGATTLNNRQFELNGTLANAPYAINVNNASGTLTINKDLLVSATGAKILNLGGTGTGVFGGNIADGTSAPITLTKAGSGTWTLSGANTYTGTTTISGGGTLAITSIDVVANANALGKSSAVAGNLILNGGTLRYTGGAASTDRLFSLQTSSSIDASGTGAVNFTNTGAMGFNTGATAKTLTLTGTNTGNNTIAAVIGDLTLATSITKTGIGTWVLSGANTNTGATNISGGGTLVLDYSSQDNSKLANAAALNISNGGGNLVLSNRTHAEVVGSTNLGVAATGGGHLAITSLGGTSKISLGVITRAAGFTGNNGGGTTMSIGQDNLATTTSANSSGMLSGAITIGSNWVKNDGSNNIIALVPADYTALPSGAGAVTGTVNYQLTGGISRSAATSINSLRIVSNADSQVLDLGANNLALGTNTAFQATGGLLYVGGAYNNYTITGTGTSTISAQNGNQETIINVYDGTLNVETRVGNGIGIVTKSGTGTLVLKGASIYTAATTVNQGVLRLQDAAATGTTTGGVFVYNNAALELANNITVGAEALTITGTGVSNAGALRNIASNTSSYAGAITIGTGGARINSDGTLLTLSGGVTTSLFNNVTFGGAGNTTVSTAAISGAGGLVKDGAGTLTLNLTNTYTGGTTLNGGTTAFVTGALSSSGNISFTGNSTLQWSGVNTQDLSSRLVMSNSVTSTLDTGVNDVSFANGIGSSSSGALTKTGSGKLTLSGATADTYTGLTTVTQGTLELNKTAGINAIAGNVAINGGILKLLASNQIIDTSTITQTSGTFNLNGKTETIVSYNKKGGTFLTGRGGSLIGTGATFTFDGVGTNVIEVDSSIVDGHVVVTNGATVDVYGANAPQDGGAAGTNGGILQVNSGGTGLEMNGTTGNTINLASDTNSTTAARLVLSGNLTTAGTGLNTIASTGVGATKGYVDLGAAGSRNFTVADTVAGTATDLTISAVISSTGAGLTKAGAGKLELTGTNSYTGNTTVTDGTLIVNGSLANTTTTVQTGATLQGSGTIGGSVTIQGGTLAPGNSIESLGVASVDFLAGSTYAYELDSSTLGGDLTYSTGTLDITNGVGPLGTTLTLTELFSGTLALNSKLTLISYTGGWTSGELFNYLGSTLADDSTFTLGANEWLFNYDDTTGGSNFIPNQSGAGTYVTMTVVPEPNVAALLGGLGVLALLRRRR